MPAHPFCDMGITAAAGGVPHQAVQKATLRGFTAFEVDLTSPGGQSMQHTPPPPDTDIK